MSSHQWFSQLVIRRPPPRRQPHQKQPRRSGRQACRNQRDNVVKPSRSRYAYPRSLSPMGQLAGREEGDVRSKTEVNNCPKSTQERICLIRENIRRAETRSYRSRMRTGCIRLQRALEKKRRRTWHEGTMKDSSACQEDPAATQWLSILPLASLVGRHTSPEFKIISVIRHISRRLHRTTRRKLRASLEKSTWKDPLTVLA